MKEFPYLSSIITEKKTRIANDQFFKNHFWILYHQVNSVLCYISVLKLALGFILLTMRCSERTLYAGSIFYSILLLQTLLVADTVLPLNVIFITSPRQ